MLDRLETDDELTLEEVDADRNREPVREQEAPAIQNGRASDARKPELDKLPFDSSPLREDESIRADDSWLKTSLRTSKPKKDKKMPKLNNEGSLFGRRVDYNFSEQADRFN